MHTSEWNKLLVFYCIFILSYENERKSSTSLTLPCTYESHRGATEFISVPVVIRNKEKNIFFSLSLPFQNLLHFLHLSDYMDGKHPTFALFFLLQCK